MMHLLRNCEFHQLVVQIPFDPELAGSGSEVCVFSDSDPNPAKVSDPIGSGSTTLPYSSSLTLKSPTNSVTFWASWIRIQIRNYIFGSYSGSFNLLAKYF